MGCFAYNAAPIRVKLARNFPVVVAVGESYAKFVRFEESSADNLQKGVAFGWTAFREKFINTRWCIKQHIFVVCENVGENSVFSVLANDSWPILHNFTLVANETITPRVGPSKGVNCKTGIFTARNLAHRVQLSALSILIDKSWLPDSFLASHAHLSITVEAPGVQISMLSKSERVSEACRAAFDLHRLLLFWKMYLSRFPHTLGFSNAKLAHASFAPRVKAALIINGEGVETTRGNRCDILVVEVLHVGGRRGDLN